MGNMSAGVKDYKAAKGAYGKEVEAAEAVFRGVPDNLTASRDLSISYKQLGSVLVELHDLQPALALFEKAMALDRARVDRNPTRKTWQLDLSFAYGAIGDLRLAEGNVATALDNYRQALELRRAVVAAEPDDTFASAALARGYGQMARGLTRMGNVSEAIDWRARRVAVYRDRLSAHPERDSVWQEYVTIALEAVEDSVAGLESLPPSAHARTQSVPRIRQLLDSLTDLSSRWTRERRPGANPVPFDQLERLFERLRRLSAPPARPR